MVAKKKAVKKKRARNQPITAKRLLFCFEYLIDQDGAHAAIRAGYSARSAASIACELLQVPEIKAIIKAGLAAKIERTKIDADWVLQQSIKVYNRCMQIEPVFDKKGNRVFTKLEDEDLVPAFTFEHAGANKALDNIGRNVEVQAFKDKVEVDASKDLLEFFAGINPSKGPPSERSK
jgi:phage terminase small subunit